MTLTFRILFFFLRFSDEDEDELDDLDEDEDSCEEDEEDDEHQAGIAIQYYFNELLFILDSSCQNLVW